MKMAVLWDVAPCSFRTRRHENLKARLQISLYNVMPVLLLSHMLGYYRAVFFPKC
jgi:hypothetical protein